jgi:hypothetical protein
MQEVDDDKDGKYQAGHEENLAGYQIRPMVIQPTADEPSGRPEFPRRSVSCASANREHSRHQDQREQPAINEVAVWNLLHERSHDEEQYQREEEFRRRVRLWGLALGTCSAPTVRGGHSRGRREACRGGGHSLRFVFGGQEASCP